MCRLDVTIAATNHEEHPAHQGELPGRTNESRLEHALRGICVWTLTALGRASGFDRLTSATLWDMAHGDALWALVLAKGVLSFGTTALALETVQVPIDISVLADVVVRAV